MTEDILNIINCVIAYKKFITIYHRDILHESEFDFIPETRKFFYTLPMPEGITQHNLTFETILSYARNDKFLNELNNTEIAELSKFNWMNF